MRTNTSVFPAGCGGGGGPSTPPRFKYYPRGEESVVAVAIRWLVSNLPYCPCGIRIFTATLVEEVRKSLIFRCWLLLSFLHLSPFFQFRKLTILPLGDTFVISDLLPSPALSPETLFPVFVPVFGLFEKRIPLIYSNFILF